MYAPSIKKDHKANNIRFEKLWNSILEVESNKMHKRNGKIVVSHKGAIGIAQLMPNTFKDIIRWSKSDHLEHGDISNKYVNLWAGKWYFNYLYYDVFPRNPQWAVSGYNGGANNSGYMTTYVGKVYSNYRGLD